METEKKDLWEFLDKDNPLAENAQHLFEWSLSFDFGQRPWELFLDIIGYSAEQYGSNLHNGDYSGSIRYMEADFLGRALREWADHPHDVEAWITDLMECEG